MKKIATFLISFLACVSVAHAGGNAKSGEQKSAACAACHGLSGKQPSAAAPDAAILAGQHAAYIASQLQAFKSGSRKSPVMVGMAASLNDDDIADLAAYYSSQVNTPTPIAEAEKVAAEKLYRGGNSQTGVAACIACHGPRGTGNDAANFPSISGQNPLYVLNALKAFRSGERVSIQNGMMNGVAASMTDQEIEAIAKYVSALH